MKMLMFDFRESERGFFDKNELSDFDITFISDPLNETTELSEELFKETDVISVFRSSHLTDKVLSRFPNLRTIATRSYGYSHIDIDYCIAHNIAVLNVEDYGEEAVAEYTISLIISLIRNMIPAIIDMKRHHVDYENYEGKLLANMTLGIVGCGETGAMVAKFAHFMGMKVFINSYMQNQELPDNCTFVSLEELLKKSDIISLHLPFTGDNYHMLGEEEFKMMKNGVYIVNTSRGELMDIKALYDNIIRGKVKGVALDVLECEFLSTHPGELKELINNSESYCVEIALVTQKLFNLKNVIITPHIAYNTTESVNFVLKETFNNIKDHVKGLCKNRVC